MAFSCGQLLQGTSNSPPGNCATYWFRHLRLSQASATDGPFALSILDLYLSVGQGAKTAVHFTKISILLCKYPFLDILNELKKINSNKPKYIGGWLVSKCCMVFRSQIHEGRLSHGIPSRFRYRLDVLWHNCAVRNFQWKKPVAYRITRFNANSNSDLAFLMSVFTSCWCFKYIWNWKESICLMMADWRALTYFRRESHRSPPDAITLG